MALSLDELISIENLLVKYNLRRFISQTCHFKSFQQGWYLFVIGALLRTLNTISVYR